VVKRRAEELKPQFQTKIVPAGEVDISKGFWRPDI